MLGRRLAGVDDGLPRPPLADAHLPEVARADRREHGHAPVEDRAHRAHVALRAVGLAPVDGELAAERVERVRVERERPAARGPACPASARCASRPGARQLGDEEPHVPRRGVRDEDGAVERRRATLGRDALEARGPREGRSRRARGRAPRRRRARPGRAAC